MAQGASRFVVRQEPLVEAGAVELVLEAVVAGVENAVTYWPHLHALDQLLYRNRSSTCASPLLSRLSTERND
jgi:hypothetical protein